MQSKVDMLANAIGGVQESAVASDDARDDEVLLDAAYEEVDVGSGL